jgi:hypothetical protein
VLGSRRERGVFSLSYYIGWDAIRCHSITPVVLCLFEIHGRNSRHDVIA